jgi:hypothetical protein
LLQSQSQLLNDELIGLKSQQPMKCSELVFVQNNPLYDNDVILYTINEGENH